MHENIVSVAGFSCRLATWPHRILARVIDLTLMILLCVMSGAFLPVAVVVSMVYLFLGNALLRGRSLGKRLTGLKVIEMRHGGPCSIIQEIVRQKYLLFFSPVFLLLPLMMLPKVALTKRKPMLSKPRL